MSPTTSRKASGDGADPGRSFGPVSEAYERARPSYPAAAATWLTGSGRSAVLELGAGTGKLTEVLHRAGHDVVATDPDLAMLARLATRAPVSHVLAVAEQIPLRSRSVDVVVCGQAFHWFDHERALPEIARVLRPGGMIALAWNTYDVGIPWVKRLKQLIGPATSDDERAAPLMETPYFGFVEQKQFRFWQPHTAATLADLARSTSRITVMKEAERARVLDQVASLYAEYGRGHDGMQVPYVTRCYRAVVRHQELPPEVPFRREPTPEGAAEQAPEAGDPAVRRTPPEDPGTQLIDFR